MTLLKPVVYEFGEFQLDRDERVLLRDGTPVPLTPKATDILLALIDRRGHIVEKADLMQQVWPDTAVEEGNLSQNIYTLRRVLGSADGRCPYIETVARRGYRFIGPVRIADPSAADAVVATAPREQAVATARTGAGPPRGWLVVVAAAGVLAGVAWWPSSNRLPLAGTVIPPIAPVTRVTQVGNVVRATIADDGRSLVYAAVTGSRETLWAKAVDSGNLIQLIEPAVGTYRRGGGLSSGPGGWVYFGWFRPDRAGVEIFRIRHDGGRPDPMPNVRDLPAFDPQGTRFACITTTSLVIGESRLLVYDAAGRSARAVATRTPPLTFVQMRPAWSPDGRQLAVWTSSARAPGLLELVIVGVENRAERVVTAKRLHAIDGMAWLRDGSSVVVAARETASAPLRLWWIALDSGAMQPLTTDVSDYLLAGLTDGGRRLAAVRVDVARTLWVAPVSDLSRARQIGSDAGELAELESLAWMPDGRMLYTSAESGNADIWVYDVALDRRQQLTTHARDDFSPASSPDGQTIVFTSDRSGASGIWAMSGDGESSARQLTAGGDSRPAVSLDGTVVFQRGVIQSAPIELWRMPLAGGTPVQLTDDVSIRPAISPDGRQVAYYWLTPDRWSLAVVPLQDGRPLRRFPLSATHCERTVRWSPDSRSLAYIDCEGGVANIWLQNLDGSPAHRLTDFKSGHITTFDWSRDGLQLAWITRTQVSDVVLIDLPRQPPAP